MFAGPFLIMGPREDFDQRGLGSFLSVYHTSFIKLSMTLSPFVEQVLRLKIISNPKGTFLCGRFCFPSHFDPNDLNQFVEPQFYLVAPLQLLLSQDLLSAFLSPRVSVSLYLAVSVSLFLSRSPIDAFFLFLIFLPHFAIVIQI